MAIPERQEAGNLQRNCWPIMLAQGMVHGAKSLDPKLQISNRCLPGARLNKLQISISNDQTEFLLNLGDWNLLGTSRFGFGASALLWSLRRALCA